MYEYTNTRGEIFSILLIVFLVRMTRREMQVVEGFGSMLKGGYLFLKLYHRS